MNTNKKYFILTLVLSTFLTLLLVLKTEHTPTKISRVVDSKDIHGAVEIMKPVLTESIVSKPPCPNKSPLLGKFNIEPEKLLKCLNNIDITNLNCQNNEVHIINISKPYKTRNPINYIHGACHYILANLTSDIQRNKLFVNIIQ